MPEEGVSTPPQRLLIIVGVFRISRPAREIFMTEGLVVLCTCPDEPTAERIARAVVAGELAACVNRVSGIRSTYRWKGALQDEPEVLLVIKTVQSRYQALEMRLKALHPYEVPEIIALPILAGSKPYLAWMADQVRTSEGTEDCV
jgi:periplasmic divalent cation tolerance protein